MENKISIFQGIYNSLEGKCYERQGYFHRETRKLMFSLPLRFDGFLFEKAVKFFFKYGIKEFAFTLGRDPYEHISAITICHPIMDEFNEENGESIVIGRIKRMRGDIKYEGMKYVKDKHGNVVLDYIGHPKLKFRRMSYIPYDLDAKKLDHKGNETHRFLYPYVFKLGGECD